MTVSLRPYQQRAVERARELIFERAAGLLIYEADTGLLRWRESRGKAKAGGVAGCVDHRGYIVLGIDGARYYAHRLAILLMTGRPAVELVDHIDGDKGNNRWANLREVTHAVNQQNQREPSKNNRLGLLGVRKFGKRFRSAITVDSAARHLGTFDTAQEAHEAYLAAKRALHEGCTL